MDDQMPEHLPLEPTSPPPPNWDRAIAIFSLLATIFIAALQANGVEMNWIVSLFIYLAIAVGGVFTCLRHAVPHLNKTWRYTASACLLLIIAGLGSWGTAKQYRREHASGTTTQMTTQEKPPIPRQVPEPNLHSPSNVKAKTKNQEAPGPHNLLPTPSTGGHASPPPQVTINSPNGIGIAGGTVINPTVNNFTPARRHLEPQSMRDMIHGCLTSNPGTALVMGLGGSIEATNYAGEWLKLIQDAGWKLQDGFVHPFIEGGATWAGTRIEINGTYNGPGGAPVFDESSPGGSFAKCLEGKPSPDAIQIVLKDEIPKDRINLLVGPQQ